MKLIKAQVTNFRSIEDSGEFDVGDTLCLVGKNEAGKSAILHALAGLNPHPSTPITYDLERDYPRRFLTEYKTRHPKDEAKVIATQWQLTEDELNRARAEFGPGVWNGTIVTVSRRYNGGIEWDLPMDAATASQYLIAQFGFDEAEKAAIGTPATSDELRNRLEKLAERTEAQNKLLAHLSKFPGKNVKSRLIELITPSLPKFMYFAHYDRMEGQIRIDTFAQRQRNEIQPPIKVGEQIFLDFLEYSGTSLEEIQNTHTYEALNSRCEAASNRITAQLLEYWTQNPNLEIDVRVTKAEPNDEVPFNAGVIARARVKNTLHKVTVPFSERSAGFVWFFSFLVKFAQIKKDGGSLILLLDEPGLTLHGKAQADLLRYFDEKLAPDHQVIFSTHSPFMVPAGNLPGVRIVEDRMSQTKPGRWITEGTKVRDDTLAADRDTLFPLQGALGYELTQTLFVGKHTLLVEGPSEILALQMLSSALVRSGKEAIDRRWTICPAGGLDKIQPFVALFSGARLDIAALTDYARGDRKKIDSLRQNQIMQGERLMTFAGLLGVDEADLEDVFDPQIYLKAVNGAYELNAKNALTIKKLNELSIGTERLVKKVEALCKLLPPDVPEFDHYTPMEWLFRNPELLDGPSSGAAETRERAAIVIRALNGLLPKK